MRRILQSVGLVLLGVFLLNRYFGGLLVYYIHGRFHVLVLLAGAVLLVVAWATWRRDGEGGASPVGPVLVMAAVLAGWSVAPRPLGSAAIATRGLDIVTGAPVPRGARPERPEPEKAPAEGAVAPEGGAAPVPVAKPPIRGPVSNLYDGVSFLRETLDSMSDVERVEASLVGLVHREEDLDENQFVLSRFLMVCCVADVVPLGIIIEYPGTAELEEGAWLRVRGAFKVGVVRYTLAPVLVAKNVEAITPPADPYLYPPPVIY